MSKAIILTRPEGQNQQLSDYFQQQAWQVIEKPCLHIERNPKLSSEEMKKHLLSCDIMIVTSANALRFETLPSPLPKSYAVGPATRRKFEILGLQSPHIPEQFSSRGLIELLKHQQIQKKDIALLTRLHSQSPIRHFCEKQAKSCTVWETYQSTAAIIDFSSLPSSTSTTIVFTSALGLKSWLDQLPPPYYDWFKQQKTLVVSENMLAFFQSWGMMKTPLLADNATDQAIIACINEHDQRI